MAILARPKQPCEVTGCVQISELRVNPECGVDVEKPNKRISGKYCVAGGPDWQPSKTSVLCSVHFNASDFEQLN